MYYATYKYINESEIAAFKTKKERDDWVNFQDPYSLEVGNTAENSCFERKALSEEEAKPFVDYMIHIKDENNPRIKWYICWWDSFHRAN